MKIAPALARAWVSHPPDDAQIALIHSADRSMAAEAAIRLAGVLAKRRGGIVERLDESELDQGAGRLESALSASSLFETIGAVRLRLETERRASVVLDILARFRRDIFCPLIVEAGELANASKLLQAFEAHPAAAAIVFYPPQPEDVPALAIAMAKERQIRLSPDAAQWIAQTLDPSTALIGAELDKLSMYLGQETRDARLIDVQAVLGGERHGAEEAAVDQALAGDVDAMCVALDRVLDDGVAGVAILLAAQRRALRLVQALRMKETGVQASEIEKRLRVFFADRALFQRALRRWTLPRAMALVAHLIRTERDMKVGGAATEAMVFQALDRMARA